MPSAARQSANGTVGMIGFLIVVAAGHAAEEPIEEIVVTSSRIPTPLREIGTAVSVISGEDIELRGYNSIADALRTQPGIAVSNSGGAGQATTLRIRGEESFRTLVMIDGIDVSDPSGPQVAPRFDDLIATGDIERVEILRGAQGFIYGADAGGVVNILTRTGAGDLAGGVSLEHGSFDTGELDAHLSGGSAAGDFYVSLSDVGTDGFNSLVADDVLRDDDGYDNTMLHTKVGLNIGDRVRLQLVARDVDARSQFDNCGFPISHTCAADTGHTIYKLSADIAAGAVTHLFSYASSDITRRSFADGIDSFSTNGQLTRLEYTGSFEPSASATLVYGVDLEEEDVAPTGEPRMTRGQDGFYFEYQGKFDDKFFVTAGARHDDNDDFGEHTSVRVSGAYLTGLPSGATVKYRASVGTGFRAPSLFEIAYNRGPFAFPPASDAALTEESSNGYDLGAGITTARGLHFEATYFDQKIEDEIFFDVSGFSGYLQSPGTSRSRGIELAGEYPFAARWTLLGNVTLNDTENNDGTQRIRRPEKLANVGIRFLSADEKLGLVANYRSSRDSVDELFGIGRIPLDDYGVLDVSAKYAINAAFEVFARLENVGDADYQEVAGYYNAGSTAAAGVRVRF